MPTNTLQGLNVVYPPTPSATTNDQDILAPPPGFPDLSAQLDLWTNLSFASDEPFVDTRRKDDYSPLDLHERALDDADHTNDDTKRSSQRPLIAVPDKAPQTHTDTITTQAQQINPPPASFDLGSFLAGFGIDPFLVPPHLTADVDFSSMQALNKPSITTSSSTNISPDVPMSEPELPPVKRSRPRKTSLVSQPSITPATLQQPIASARAVSEFSEDHDPLSTPLTASEDKRRRNTAASARFRAKKKEREQAMEKRSKELESRVNELERECEGLRRENGWLKGLVVGVTGGNPSSVKTPAEDEVTAQEVSKKRKRDSDSVKVDS